VVFGEPHRRHADRPHDPRGEVVAAADVVMHLARDRIENRPLIVKSRRWASSWAVEKTHAGWMAAVGVGLIGAEGGHLDLAGLLGPRTVITPKAAPMASVRRWPKTCRTWSGVAAVATS